MQFSQYVLVDTLNKEKLIENTIISLLKELYPHSVYIPKNKVAEMSESLSGNFQGIGISYNIKQTLIQLLIIGKYYFLIILLYFYI